MKKISIKIFFLIFLLSCSNNQNNLSTNVKKIDTPDKTKDSVNITNDANKAVATSTDKNTVEPNKTTSESTKTTSEPKKDITPTPTTTTQTTPVKTNNDKNIKNTNSTANAKPIPVNVSKVEVVNLYSEFKQKNQIQLQKKIDSKTSEIYDVKIYLNKGFKDNKVSVNVLSANDLLSSNANDGDVQNVSSGVLKSSAIMNDNPSKLNFVSSSIIIELQNKLKLEDLNKLYNIKVLKEARGIYNISIDINKADISKLPNLIKEYNKTIFVNIKDIQFSSVASLKTFTILLDLLINHKDICKSANLNTLV